MTVKSISVLGSGWLGLPLASYLLGQGYMMKVSTTSQNRLPQLVAMKVKPFIVDIGKLSANIQSFLQANLLIVNIPSRDIDGFAALITQIEQSVIEKVIFVSTTSVYEDKNRTVSEDDGAESFISPYWNIENLFRKSSKFTTTVVRFGGLIGPDRNPGKFFSSGRILDNPESPVNLIHRDDCIAIIGRIINQETWGHDFNCCADTHPTKREFYTKAAQAIGRPAPEFMDSTINSYKIINNQKVKQVLNYTFMHADLMKIDL